MPHQPRTVEELLDVLAPELVNGRRPSWHDRAACRGSTVDFFSERHEDVAAARDVCRGCPVAPQCAHYGADERYGVWGGVAAVERGHGRRRPETRRKGPPGGDPFPARAGCSTLGVDLLLDPTG